MSSIPDDFRLSSEQMTQLKDTLTKKVKDIQGQSLRVSVLGQTGTGKSTNINALFGTKLKTDPVKPCTKEIEKISITNKQGHTVEFNDLPGFGESEEADAKYLQSYSEHLENSDVVLWFIHADNRSVTFDLEALNKLMSGYPREQQAMLMSKLTFVLTKADVLHPPAWMMLKFGNFVKFLPPKTTAEILDQKADYYQKTFLKPYGGLILSKTYNDCNFCLTEDGFTHDEYLIYYNGYMDAAKLQYYKNKYPNYAVVFERLYHNYQVIPCSSLLKFNLNKLMLVIINKLGREATIKLKSFLDDDNLDKVPLETAKQFCNLTVFEPQRNKKLFDFSELNFDQKWRLL